MGVEEEIFDVIYFVLLYGGLDWLINIIFCIFVFLYFV